MTMSLFGEIVEPTSRTTWEDWDDDFAQNTTLRLNWSDPLEVPDSINTVFILEGKYLSNCSRYSTESKQLVNSIDEASLKLYKVPSTNNVNYVCTIRDYDIIQSSSIVDILKPIICKSDNVVSIITKPLSEYNSANVQNKSCIIRKLKTSIQCKSTSELDKYENLEQPNIISGVSAGVTSLREHMNLPATILVYFIENSDDLQIEELNNQLKAFHIIKTCKGMNNSVLTSNLYI